MKKFIEELSARISESSLLRKIAISFSLLIFLVLLIMSMMNFFLMRITFKTINKDFVLMELKEKEENLNDYFYELNFVTRTFIGSNNIQSFYKNPSEFKSYGAYQLNMEAKHVIGNSSEGIYMETKDGVKYKILNIEMEELIRANRHLVDEALENTSGELVIISRDNHKNGSEFSDYILCARKVRSLHDFKELGILVVVINSNKLYDFVVSQNDIGETHIIDFEGNIIASDKLKIGNNIAEYLQKTVDKRKLIDIGTLKKTSIYLGSTIVNVGSNDDMGLNIIHIVEVTGINYYFRQLYIAIFISFIIAVIINIALSVIISNNITKPIHELIVSMREVGKGIFDVKLNPRNDFGKTDEIVELQIGFNNMSAELKNLVDVVYEKQIKEKESELKALKAQINPHFLYNTLDVIYWMLIDKDVEDVAEVVRILGDMFRYNIRKDTTIVSIRDEIEQIKRYLFIQKIRYEERLEFAIKVEKDLLEQKIISFLIQPFVENAIIHGIMKHKGHGKVTIEGYAVDNFINIKIQDDGVGMKNSIHDGEAGGSGIGIQNVKDRIRLVYGDDYGIAIESNRQVGTTVSIRVPLDYEYTYE